MILIFVIVVVAAFRQFRKTQKGRHWSDRTLLKLPLFGNLAANWRSAASAAPWGRCWKRRHSDGGARHRENIVATSRSPTP